MAFYKKDIVFIQRDDTNSLYQQVNVSASNAIIYVDSDGHIAASKISLFPYTWPSSSHAITSSFSFTASYASVAGTSPPTDRADESTFATSSLSASFASSSISSSHSITSSYALIAGSSPPTDRADESTFATSSLSSSFASSSISSSHSITSSNSITASHSLTTTLTTGDTFEITSSWAITSSMADSASYALTASHALNVSAATSDSSSWASSSISASHAINADTASYVLASSIIGNIVSASHALISDTASYVSASSVYGIVESSSYARTASVALTSLSSTFATSASVVGIGTAASDSLYNVTFVTASSGYAQLWVDDGFPFAYNPSKNLLYVPYISSSLEGTSSWSRKSEISIESIYATSSLSSSFASASISSSHAQTASYFGSGSNNYFPQWNSNTLTATSFLYGDSSHIGIGTTDLSSSPVGALIINESAIRHIVLRNEAVGGIPWSLVSTDDNNLSSGSRLVFLAGSDQSDTPALLIWSSSAALKRVGINKTHPTVELDVSGSISASYYYSQFDDVGFVGTASWAQNTLSASYIGGLVDSSSYSETASYFGSGSNNYVPKWTDNKLTYVSSIYNSGSGVGVNTTTINRDSLRVYNLDTSATSTTFAAISASMVASLGTSGPGIYHGIKASTVGIGTSFADLRGGTFEVNVIGAAATSSAVYGLYVSANRTGTIHYVDNLYGAYLGVRVDVSADSGAFANNVYGLYIPTIYSSTSEAISNRWGIYQQGTLDRNYFGGNVGIGAAPTTNKLNVAGNVVPNIDNIYDLGTSTLRWRYLYANTITASAIYGTASYATTSSYSISSSWAETASYVSGNFWQQGGNEWGELGYLGTTDEQEVSFIISGSELVRFTTGSGVGILTRPTDFTLQIAGAVGPSLDNTYDLGSPSLRWRNVYAANLVASGSIESASFADSASIAGTAVSASHALRSNTSSLSLVSQNSDKIYVEEVALAGNAFPVFVVNSADGYQSVYKENSNYFFNPAEGLLTVNFVSASSFTGSLQGTASRADSSLSSSYAITASHALNVSVQSSDSASWASSSIWSERSTIATSSLYASQSVSSSVVGIGTVGTDSLYYLVFVTGSSGYQSLKVDDNNLTYNPTTNTLNVSYITASLYGSASYALSASWAPMPDVPSTDSASWASSSISASHALNADLAISADFAALAGYADGALSASYALTASFALNGGGGGGTVIESGSSWNITASWAHDSISASYAITASYALNGGGGGTVIESGSSWNITASMAKTASYFYSESGSGAWHIYVEPTFGDLVFDFV